MASENKNTMLWGLGLLGGAGLIYYFFFRGDEAQAAPRAYMPSTPSPSPYTQPAKSSGGGGVDPKVLAFQKQWNAAHPNDKITEDGKLGPETKKRMDMAAKAASTTTPTSSSDIKFEPVVPFCDQAKPGQMCKERGLFD